MGKKRRRQVTGLTEAERVERGERIAAEVKKHRSKMTVEDFTNLYLYQQMMYSRIIDG